MIMIAVSVLLRSTNCSTCRGVLVLLMLSSLGSPSIGVFEDNTGAIDLGKTH